MVKFLSSGIVLKREFLKGPLSQSKPFKSSILYIYFICLFSGFFAYVVSFLALLAALYFKVPVTIVYDKFIPLMTSAIIFSFALAVFLYIKAKLGPENKIAPGGNTGMKSVFSV